MGQQTTQQGGPAAAPEMQDLFKLMAQASTGHHHPGPDREGGGRPPQGAPALQLDDRSGGSVQDTRVGRANEGRQRASVDEFTLPPDGMEDDPRRVPMPTTRGAERSVADNGWSPAEASCVRAAGYLHATGSQLRRGRQGSLQIVWRTRPLGHTLPYQWGRGGYSSSQVQLGAGGVPMFVSKAGTAYDMNNPAPNPCLRCGQLHWSVQPCP